MKYYRPGIEIEALPQRDQHGNIIGYHVDFLDGKATKHFTPEEFQAAGFRKMNGQDPVKKRKSPQKKSVAEAFVDSMVRGKGYTDSGTVEPAQEYDHQ